MKVQNLLIPMVLLASCPAMAYDSSGMPSDCAAIVRTAVAATSYSEDAEETAGMTAVKFDSKAIDAVVISDVKGTYIGNEERGHTIYTAKVKNNRFSGMVKVSNTRGGCFLQQISLR